MELQWVRQVLLDLLHHNVLVNTGQVPPTIHPPKLMDLLLVFPDQVLPLQLVQVIIVIVVKIVEGTHVAFEAIALELPAGCTDLGGVRREKPGWHAEPHLTL